MIEQVERLTKKSYSNYTGPNNSFVLNNIIYGENGNGKTSLAEGLYEQVSKSYGETEIYFFDKQYINTNIMIEDSDSLKGVKVNFGKRNISIEEDIKKLALDKEAILNEIKTLEMSNRKINNLVKDEIESVFKNRRGKAAIQQKVGIANDSITVLKRWIAEFVNAEVKFPGFDFSKGYDANELQSDQKEINESPIQFNYEELSVQLLHEVQDIMNKSHIASLKNTQILKWLEKGVYLHRNISEDESCEFCGNPFKNREERLKDIDLWILDETNKDRGVLKEYLNKLDSLKKIINSFHIDSIALRTDEKIKTSYDSFKKTSESVISIIETIEGIVNKKMTEMSNVFLDFESKINLNEFKNILMEMKNRRQEILESLGKEINKEADIVKGVIGCELKNNSLLIVHDTDYNNNLLKIKELTETSLKNIEIQIGQKLGEKTNIDDFRKLTNRLLNAQGLSIDLEIDGEDYCIRNIHDRSKKLSLKDISEGEKNLLVFLYFYNSLYDELNKINDKIKFIIIDDPISSLDQNNKMLITVLLEEIMENSKSQKFILTHSWEDYSNMVYGTENKPTYKTFECIKISGKSQLIEFKGSESLYKRLFKQVYEFSVSDYSLTTEQDIIHMPNAMRRILESYLRFNYLVSNATVKSVGEIKDVFHRADIGKRQDPKIKILLKVTNILSHGTGHELLPNNKEIHESAIYLMSLFNQHDIKHYSRMIN